MSKKENILRWIILCLTIAVNVFIIVNGFIEGGKSAKISSGVSQVIEEQINIISPGTITDVNRSQFKLFTRKFIGHFCLFILSGNLTTMTYLLFFKKTKLKLPVFSLIFSLATGLLIAGVSELAQITTEDRVASMKDVGIDFAGFSIGLIVVFLILGVTRLIIKFNDAKKQA